MARFPHLALQTMTMMCSSTTPHHGRTRTPLLSKLESIASSAVRAADKVAASLILVYTHTGACVRGVTHGQGALCCVAAAVMHHHGAPGPFATLAHFFSVSPPPVMSQPVHPMRPSRWRLCPPRITSAVYPPSAKPFPSSFPLEALAAATVHLNQPPATDS